jgi:hypothetical protein
MKIDKLKEILAKHASKTVRFVLPTGAKVPPHAHVTEVARIDKKFMDCGGTIRTESVCQVQTWFQDDTGHRLSAGTLLKILDKSRSVVESDDLEVEVEHEAPFISHFPIVGAEAEGHSLVFKLGVKHTECLAQDRCQSSKEGDAKFEPFPSIRQAVCCGSEN